jgi:hypothetical protein
MRASLRVAACLACLLIFGSCSDKAASSYGGTSKLAEALNSNGIACSGFAPSSGGGPATEGAAAPVKKGAKPLVQEAGTCMHDGSKVLLFTFRSPALRDRWLDLGKLYGSVVVGPNWTVSTRTADLAAQISSAIGGDVH